MTETAVVIANWNGKKYLKDCLDSLRAQTFRDFKTIFIDNGSVDGSVEYVKENYPEVETKEISRNVGFAAGYNLGIREALKNQNIRRIVALNNDTKLDENFLEEMIACAKNHPKAGSIQSKVLNFFDQKKIDCTGIVLAGDGTAHNRGYGEVDAGQYEKEEEIFGANATAALYSRESLEKTVLPGKNFFDRDHFAYYEDADLAWRMRLAGFKSYYCPKSLVFHVHSASTGLHSLFKAYYLHRNYFFTIFKNYPSGIMVKTLARRLVSYVQLVFNASTQKGKKEKYTAGYGKKDVARAIAKAWGSVFVDLPVILKKRRFIQKRKVVSGEEIQSWLCQFGAR